MQTAASSGSGPLAGLRVVELANFVSGPFATMMLADLGADVVKVEASSGDPLRRFGRSGAPVSPLFVNTNRGKRSVVLDLKNERDRGTLRVLLTDADVMVCNWRPAVAPRLGVVDGDLVRANPRLVRIYVSGFGPSGPLAGAPTYDSIVQAHLGAAEGADENTAPTLASTYVVDKAAAAMVCQAALAALVARERGGPAERVDVALLDAVAYLNFPDLMANRTFLDAAPAEATNRHAAAVRPIRGDDGWMVVAPVTANQIRRAFEVVGAPARADELLATKDATALTVRMLDALEERTRAGSVRHWVGAFVAADVPAGACLTLDEHLDDPQVRHNSLYGVANWDGLGRVRHARYPGRFSSWGTSLGARGAPPATGEHTDEVLAEIASITPYEGCS